MGKFVMIDAQTLPDADFHQERQLLAAHGIACALCACKTDAEVVDAAADAEAIGVNYYRVTEALLTMLPKLKLVVRYGIGYDVVDVEACTRHGVMLCNLPSFCVPDVATHALGMALDLCRKISVFNAHVRLGEWDVGYGYPVHRLGSLTIGLLGFGNIAREFRRLIGPFGAKVIAYDPYLPQQKFDEAGVESVTLDALFQRADLISLHVPSTPETHHIINRENIEKMKDGVMLVNTSRGPLVDTDALVEGMRRGKVLAAALDVVENEPIRDARHPMFENENLIVTPHTSYNSVESSDDQHTQVAETVIAYFAGEKLGNLVNRQLVES